MDEYDRKFAEMQKYIPFLEAMIERLQNDRERRLQLQKMQSLLGILSNNRRKLKIETLERCEDVLQKLYNKVEKFQGNTPGLQLPFRHHDFTPQPSTSRANWRKEAEQSQDAEKDKEIIEETPASPDTARSSSPDCQILPIVIPTERNKEQNKDKRQKQCPKIIPVITLDNTKTNTITISSPSEAESNTDDVTCTEWDMLEESERHNSRNRENRPSSLTATSHDVSTAAKLISDSLPQKVSDSRSYELNPQDILTVPVPSLGGSRRLSSVLEKNKLHLSSLNINIANSSRPESPVNVPEVRLNSPDPEILFAKPITSSPRSKDSHNTSKPPSKPPSIPLLFSPPPLSHEPPLSMEDLAELLNEGDGENGNKNENAAKKKQETDKTSKNLPLSEREKLTTRKHLPSTAGISPVKSSATSSIGPSHQSNDSHRSTSIFQEPRYADNYERHPRQRDAHSNESAKDKSTSSPIILEEISPQISILHNTANKPNERNVPLYQRRPPEGWKETNLPRQENEFMIDNTNYYNMHTNQMHWSSPTATSDHQFGNTQWIPSSYGMTNPPLQPTQHPFQHPMEPQFRQSQFPPALPTGPRPLINPAVRPQEMSHVRPENIREDIPSSIPSGFPSQYRGFQMGQGSYDPSTVGRPTEYPHVRPTWESSANRVNETTFENVIPCGIQVIENSTGNSYPRPNTPCPWGTRDRSNRGQGRDGYYERNRTEVRPSFNRDGRRTDWSRDGHSDRESLNRFLNRDPRVRTEHNVTSANQAKDTSFSARDPRLAKDKHVNASTKDTVHNERDPRIRDPKPAKTMVTKEKPCSQKSPEKDKLDKLPKDRMQSPLESLYGVIDTKASQNSGLHKFKIPKIKRPESSQSSRIINEKKNTENTSSKPSRAKSSSSKNNKSSSNKNKDVASAEVSSSSDGNHTTENSIQQNNTAKEGKIISSSVDNEVDSVTNSSKSSNVTKKSKKKNESDAHGSKFKNEVTEEWIEALIRKSFESGTGKKLVEQAKLLQKLGEAIKAKNYKKIKKIIDSSEKLKRSESESSSDKDETVEAKKIQTKKKRRVIVSDSSDDECLAERLGILNTDTDINDEREMISAISTDPKNSEKKLEVTVSSSNSSKELTKDITVKENDNSLKICNEKHVQIDNNSKNKDVQLEKKNDKNDRLEDGDNENIVQSESEKPISSEGKLEDEDKHIEDNLDKIDQSTVEKSKDSTENSIKCLDQNSTRNNIECLDQDKDQTTQSVADITDQTDEILTDKPKTKTRRRNSLEMLQEDIREMFISEGVVTATGYRMCRLSKDGQPPSGISTSSTNSKKDETSNTAEKKIMPNTETSELVASNTKSRKSLRSRNVGESSKLKAKKIRSTRNLRLQKSILNSDSEEDQPLALRTEKLRNSTPNQEVDHSEESNDAFCKSKHIVHKDIIKEPRVLVEKTDITKLESKVMFDSSSDESFGIDVSELAAAVDNSLRPDKSDQDSVETVISSKRQKNVKNASKRKSKKSGALTDNKSEESFTDEESVISDISMSSSTTVAKKTSGGAARTTTKEELLSNLLIGLMSTTEKNTSIDKGNEADYEEDVNDPLAIEPSAKKSLVKKKKKKSSWQMGIVTTKKKKKKTASGTSSKTAQTNVEKKNIETNISMGTGQADQSILGDNEPVTANKTAEKILGSDHALVDDANIDLIVKRELNEINSLVNTDNFGANFKDLGNFTALSESSNTILKEETLINESFSIEESKPIKEEIDDLSSANLITTSSADVHTDTANKFFKDSPEIIYDELMTELSHRIDIKHLINYAWAGQDKYKCLLCFFTGKNIVHHYKVNHPGKEVLISRLKSTDAETAIMETERGSLASMTEMNQMCKFRCRFCCFVTEGAADVALEAFYEHCTTHTGEYRFHCNNCSYQAVAKASMKTHYYKVCRKDTKTFNESASEDVIPREGGIYGYLCCSCNYIQLKRQNVEAHVAFWHQEQIGNEILKINMSAISDEHAASNNEQSPESASVNAEESFTIETKPQVPVLQCEDMPLMDIARSVESEDKDANTNECSEPKTEEDFEIKQEAKERPKLSQRESEGPVTADNLSVFVVPPELENKEIEIQRERQKTMQEIANNIGILLKNSKPGLSIIDKLQNKMRTDAVVSPVPECDTSADIPKTKENPSLPFVSAFEEPLKSEELIIKEDSLSQPSSQEDPLFLTGEQVVVDTLEVTNNENDKMDVKIRDPLTIMDSCKDNESDGENNNNERSAPIFESDSSSEQSDSEQTDVNMILKETSNMNASSSRDPMLTTIQRLAAQLQNTKPLEPVPEPMHDIKMKIKTEPTSVIPKPPDVISIANVKHLLTKQQNANKKETLTSASKNFIRPRRLSGDMLSMPTQSSDNQEDPQESNTDGAQSDNATDAQQTDTEEGCSFLKIENVFSIAPGSNESIIVNDIRKAMEISPTKNKEISILRKSNQPLILKKIILPQLVNTNLQVTPKLVVPSSTSPSALNCRKKIKVIRTFLPSGIATKEITPVTIHFKSPNAYAAMLTKPKLAHFYKCMEPNCDFTTDVELDYSQHYLKHYVDSSKQNSPVSRDYEKCAYCNMSLKDWMSMKAHLQEKHIHCRYQCGYCFYRAIVPSFVQLHQTTCHPGTESCTLLGKMLKPVPTQEIVNRTEYVMPFVCKLDCGKLFYIPETFITHLKTKHPTSLRYRCHLCNSTHFTIELLMSHYRLHEYSKYQCLYCLCGRDNLNEMHQHLSFLHQNRLPQILERSLPLTPSRDKDVIQQLLLRMFDQKTNEGGINLNADDSKKNTTKKDATNDQISTASLNVKSVLNEARSNPPNNSRKDNVIGTVNDNLKNIEVNISNILTKLPADVSLANANEKTRNSIAEKSVQKEPSLQSETEKLSDCATSQILRESQLELLSSKNDSNAIDSNSIEFSGEFNCSDEFVNTNLLDNVELFKKFTPNSGNLSKATDKTEDSDIEILDSEERVVAQENVENDVNKITEEAVLESKIDIVDENIKEQTALSDTTETQCTPEDVSEDNPLTLDDIKDTGLTGHDLYKCGYLDCNFTAPNAVSLKAHIKKCNLVTGEPIKNLFCPHCKKRFVKIGLLLEHMKTHGLKRFGCSLCKLRYSVSYQATAHMKQKHKLFNSKLVPADPTNPSADGLFIVQAGPHGYERKSKKRKGNKSGTEQENEKSANNEKLSFSPDEIEQLPRQAIYNREVQCAVCPYTTKVRTNIIRHLRLHAKDETVPESGPVNPVPCLDKKEKMFDKMVNLASSSHQNGRMGPKPREAVKESEEDNIPKFVPEHERYVCGVAECNYLTVDEAMLRNHLKALHSEEPYFRCPHCPSPSPGQENHIAIDKMGIHLKMHDTRLYKCSHCNHHHYHRHVVERHLTDKHPEKRPFVKVIREIENTENVQQPIQEETEEEVPDPDGNHWKCNLCDFKCVYKADAVTHADTVHGESSQYKCTVCPFKTSGKVLLEQHINNKHTYDTNADYTMIYQRIKGINKRNTEAVEQGGQDEPFDTTPLWRRNMPRVRHIRGILLEEETEESATSEMSSVTSKVSLGKRKSDAEIGTKPAKIKSTGKSTSLDENNKQNKEKLKRSFSCEADGEGQIMKENAQGKFDSRSVTGNKSNKDSGELSDSDMGRFGPYGKPEGNMYVCTLCNHFKTKYKHDMRDHLYRELKYPRWHCKVCGYLSVNRKSLLQHFGKRHNGECPEHEPLTPDNSIEDWVTTLLKRQSDMIKATLRGTNVCKSTSSSNPDASLTKALSTDKKTVNLAPTISNLQNDILEDTNRSNIDTDDGDSQDEDLVIDMKEDEDRSNDESENDKLREKTDDDLVTCKHCQMKFTRLRGFKLHVQYSHLKRFGFLCPYCDRSSNSEMTIRQHIRAKHPGDPEKCIHNADAWANPKLNDEFWEKEYGLSPQKTKKRKLNPENNVTSPTAVTASTGNRVEKCKMRNFTATNYTSLKSHMKVHDYKHKFKCQYCTYSCSFKAEMLEHCNLNHPSVPWKFKELSSAGSSSVETKNKPSTSQKQDVDASKNVEEELRDPAQTVYYGCFYCNLRSNSLPSIKQHWNLMHKEVKSSDNVSAKFPFRYKEISVQKVSHINSMNKEVTTPDKTKQTENLSPVVQQHGWICEWCKELCKTDTDRVRHQNMYHSHLPHKWEKQQQQQTQDQSKDTSVRLPVCSFEKYATNSKTVPSFESVVERLKHIRQTEYNDIKNDQSSILDISTSEGDSSDGPHGIARKSTTKSIVPCAKPGPRVFKAVARKSTNPRPSVFTPHLSVVDSTDTEFEEDVEEEEEEVTRSKAFSYYGIPSSPIHLAELNTYMVVGGHSMRVNCMTLATLIDIKPKVVLKDIKKDPKYAASLSNLD